MASLKLYLFGSPQIELNGQSVTVGRRKALALLLHLAVTAQDHSREKLTTLFWPEHEPKLARSYLRRELSALKTTLGGRWLNATRQDIGLDPIAGAWIDVAVFRGLLASADAHSHVGDEVCPDCLASLTQAVSLYREPFLEGFTLPDTPAFDEWQFFQAEGLVQQLSQTLQRLLGWHMRLGEYEKAIEYGRRWLTQDPLHEPAHRELMKLYAWSDQQAAALRQYQECLRLLDEELGVLPEEETTSLHDAIRLRRLAPPTAVEQRRSKETEPRPLLLPDASAGPRPSEQGEVPNNLPPQPTPFIGRERELAALDELLADPQTRLITIVGPGGMGKTRLALASAERLAGAVREPPLLFKDGVYFVSLAPLTDSDHIVPTLAESLDFPLETGEQQRRTPRRQILDYLRRKQLLLIMDNFEHLLDGAELLTAILETASGVQIVATSRERLHLQQEQVFAIQGLEFPDWETPEDAAEYTAVKLFIQSARRVQHDFRLQAEDLVFLTRICRLLEGMPLGIELAAAWVDMLSLADIAAEIQKNLDFLETEVRDVPERHRSMRAAFDASWQQMSPAERHLFPQLSVFRGGFTRKAAQAVAASSDGSPPSLRILGRLTSKSLLQYNQARDRYQIHELLRQYGAEKLAELPLENSARDHHSAYYCEALQEREASLEGAGQQDALFEIEADIENVRAAWEWAIAHEKITRLRQAMECLGYFYQWQGRYQEGERAFHLAVEALSQRDVDDDKPLSAKCCAWQSVFNRTMGRTEAAGHLLQRALDLLDGVDMTVPESRSAMAFIQLLMGRLVFTQDVEEARNWFQKSLDYYKALSDQWGMATATNGLGQAAQVSGDFTKAKRYLEESLTIQRLLGDKMSMATSLYGLCFSAMYSGRVADGESLARESYALYRELGDRASIASGAGNLGIALLWTGKFEEGRRLLEESLAIYEDLGDQAMLPRAHTRLSSLLMSLGSYESARSHAQTGLALAHEIGDQFVIGFASRCLGWRAVVRGDYLEARRHLRHSLDAYQKGGVESERNWPLVPLGYAEYALGNIIEARQLLYEALRIGVVHQNFRQVLTALLGIAMLWSRDPVQEETGVDAKVWRAIELHAMVWRHPMVANSRQHQDTIGKQLTAAASALPPDVVEAAQERGRALDLWQTAAELLDELTESGWGDKGKR